MRKISLNKQIHIYSVDTSAFYNEEEQVIHKQLNDLFLYKRELVESKKKFKENHKDDPEDYYKKELTDIDKYITSINKSIQYCKDGLYQLFKQHNGVRNLNPEYINDKNIISVFDSALTRIIGISENTLSKDLIIVQTYFFDVIQDIIIDGFTLEGEEYVCLTASAGQIRTKKTVFIRKSVFLKHQNSLMCGLTPELINKKGGVNINKYLAYLALSNSATDLWESFDIRKSIVVDDMETAVRGLVDFIDDETYEITRKEMDIPISHTDGCGIILPQKSSKNMMVRLPWIKGLLSPFPFDKFIEENNQKTQKYCGKVLDIYGKEHDILKEGIEIIFTKSQFKMYKYYDSWEQYTENFLKYNCQAGKCNEEEDIFSDAKINYQMLQTLTDMTTDELETISKRTKNSIRNIGSDRRTMLKVLGVIKSNIDKNYIQKALELYPELLNDTYCKQILKQVKKSMVKDAKAGRIDINGKYTFICPDLYAFCEYLFLGNTDPKGLLSDGEVYCKLYDKSPKLDCLRSPHLYREHAIRKNIIDEEKSKWFITNGLYTSCHDTISKILMFDVDGDKSLVCADPTIIQAAERNMQGIVPLFYNMRKAGAENIHNQSIYNGLKTAYTGGNIGAISNNITKIWNSENINLDVIKLLCMENNFVIDYAKTLYKPKRPDDKSKMITDYTKLKTPHFFIYAKDKKKTDVEIINNSLVNRLDKIITNPRINFNASNLGNLNFRMLMKNPRVKMDSNIVDKYKELELKSHFMISFNDEKHNNIRHQYKDIREKILQVNSNIHTVVDVLVKYLYAERPTNYKTTLWECFGDVIIENIKRNIKTNNIYCEKCGDLVEQSSNRQKYCKSCFAEIRELQNREKALRYYHKNKNFTT